MFFNPERISQVTENLLLAIMEETEELDAHVLLTVSVATEGVRQGLIQSIENNEELKELGERMLIIGRNIIHPSFLPPKGER